MSKHVAAMFGIGVGIALVTACAAPPRTSARLQTVIDNDVVRPDELLRLTICSDSLGVVQNGIVNGVCMPCLPTMAVAPENALRYSRRLATSFPTVNMVSWQNYARCIRYGYEAAIDAGIGGMPLRTELAVFDMFSLVPSRRAKAIHAMDANIDTVLVTGDSITAAEMLETMGLGAWNRAQQMLARPANLAVYMEEEAVHDIGNAVGALKHVPAPPPPSVRLGESENEWARMLFTEAASLVRRREAKRTRATRFALATWVIRGEWKQLDSAASAVLAAFPRDSVAPLARALARFHMIRDPMAEYSASMALFDSALRALPRADSLSFDAFDELLKHADDQWRKEHLLEQLTALDARSWSVFDPIWLTPVNEIQLVRRARMAEANFRYAHLAKDGQSGSETPLGIMLLRRGVPDERWKLTVIDVTGTMQWHRYERRWPGRFGTTHEFRGDSLHWMSMYTDDMSLQQRVHMPLDSGRLCLNNTLVRTLFQCARDDNASWFDVPFEAKQDTVEVTAARFRSGTDSVDMYLGARFPTRRFPRRGEAENDSIVYGAIIAAPLGQRLFEARHVRQLPANNEQSWKAEWRTRVPTGDVMHRIEAYEPRKLASARGSRMLTSTSAATFSVTGFGMSDVLVADSIIETRAPRNWRDLRTVANGAVIGTAAGIAMGWEIYGLSRGPDGRSRWRVTLSREDGRPVLNMDVRSLIVGDPAAGVKVVSNEPNASIVNFERNEPSKPIMVEHIRFRFPDVEPGRHVLRVRIEDLINNRITQRSVSIRVLDDKAQAR